MYVMDMPTKWKEYLHLVEFAYNNNYRAFLKMSPFEVLYGRKCRAPISWDNLVDKLILSHEMLKEMEQVVQKAKQNLKVAQDRQKEIADLKKTHKEFDTRDHVYLKVRPKRSTLKLRGCSKLEPRFCRPFQVLVGVGLVTYQLALPANIKVHNVFHVSLLLKYVHDVIHVVDWNVI